MGQVEHIDIDYITRLARIDLSEAERAEFSGQLDLILEYFEALAAVDVENIEPMAHATTVYNVWREDEPGATFAVQQTLLNAPESSDNQVVVPRVVD